jgi:ABC-type transport system substrate-binding protein
MIFTRHIAGLMLLGATGFLDTHGMAQVRMASRSTLIVGLLKGESDYRTVELATSEGAFPVFGFGNSRPFETVESSETRILVKLKTHGREDGIYPDKIEYRFFDNERSLVTAIILDEVDYARIDGASSAEEIARHNRRYRVQPLPPPHYTVALIAFNYSNNILRSKNLRQALAYGINRKEIYQRNLTVSGADIIRGPFDEDSDNVAPGMNDYDYNPKKAIALLRSDGWRDTDQDNILDRDGQPLRFQLLFQDGLTVEEQVVRQIKIDWLRLGIDVQPVGVSATDLNDKRRAGKFDAVLMKQRFEETPASLEAFFGDGMGGGYLRYVNANFNHVLQFCKRLKDGEARRPSLQRLQVILNDEQAATFLYSQWNTYYIINHAKFDNYMSFANRQLKPFLEWRLRRLAP